MSVGALIVAAGMSSRMGDFKPMLNIGSISIAQRIVATFHQAGVNKIVVVTGYNAAQLERHLSNSGLIFLRNEAYATTQMFDSAKIGLRGRTDIKTDPIGIRATDETGSGSNWKIDSFRIGTPVSVYAQNDSWAEVDAGGYHAYLLNEYVVLDPEEQEN